MRIEELASEHAHSIPGFELIYFSEIAFPFWRVNLKIQILQEKPLNVVDEFLLKLVDTGVNKIEKIGEILGLKYDIVKDSAITLLRNEIISFNSSLKTIHLTNKGKEILKSLILITPETVPFTFCINGITGDYCPFDRRLIPPNSIKQTGIRSLHTNKQIEYPSESNINFDKFYHFYKELNQKGYTDMPRGELLDIIEFEKVWPMFKIMRVLTYYNYDQKIYQFTVYDRNERAPEYDGILTNLDNEEDLLPLEEYPYDEVESPTDFSQRVIKPVEEEATQNLSILNKTEQDLKYKEELLNSSSTLSRKTREEIEQEINNLREQIGLQKRSTRLLRTFEHRPLLEESFKSAKKWVIIVSPWLTPEAFDNSLISLMEKALQRKVKVIILYGYPGMLSAAKDNPIIP